MRSRIFAILMATAFISNKGLAAHTQNFDRDLAEFFTILATSVELAGRLAFQNVGEPNSYISTVAFEAAKESAGNEIWLSMQDLVKCKDYSSIMLFFNNKARNLASDVTIDNGLRDSNSKMLSFVSSTSYFKGERLVYEAGRVAWGLTFMTSGLAASLGVDLILPYLLPDYPGTVGFISGSSAGFAGFASDVTGLCDYASNKLKSKIKSSLRSFFRGVENVAANVAWRKVTLDLDVKQFTSKLNSKTQVSEEEIRAILDKLEQVVNKKSFGKIIPPVRELYKDFLNYLKSRYLAKGEVEIEPLHGFSSGSFRKYFADESN